MAPAAAQRPFCDFGEGVAALRQAQQGFSAPVSGLVAGREAAQAIANQLRMARTAFNRCGCPRMAEMLEPLERMAEAGVSQSAASQIRESFDQAGFHTRLARDALDRDGCR
jgi:hypothetical protein